MASKGKLRRKVQRLNQMVDATMRAFEGHAARWRAYERNHKGATEYDPSDIWEQAARDLARNWIAK